MKSIILMIFLLVIAQVPSCFGQKSSKPSIDTSLFDNWPMVGTPVLSYNGKYASYNINEKITIKEIYGSWETKLIAQQIQFTADSKNAIFINSGDTLCIMKLGCDVITHYPKIESFKLSGAESEVLAMKLKGSNKLEVINLKTSRKKIYTNIDDYLFSKNGEVLLVVKAIAGVKVIEYINFKDKVEKPIWKGDKVVDFTFDLLSEKVAFVSESTEIEIESKTLWVYEFGEDQAELILKLNEQDGTGSFMYDGISSFTCDGKNLFIYQKKDNPIVSNKNRDNIVDIWSYEDHRLRSEQNLIESQPIFRTSLVNIDKKILAPVAFEDEDVNIGESGANQTLFLISTRENSDVGTAEDHWNGVLKRKYYLFNTKCASRIPLPALETLQSDILFHVSPNQKFIIFFNGVERNYFSYEISTGRIRNISKTIKTNWSAGYNGENQSKANHYSKGIAGWIVMDKAVLLYDRNDIWEVDPLGLKNPVNLTNGYGFRNDIVFEMALSEYSNRPRDNFDGVLLSAFDYRTKKNGFYHISLHNRRDPEKIIMNDYMYNFQSNVAHCEHVGMRPIKAKNSNIYVVRRESTTESPNFFATRDFKNYIPISHNYPEKSYNWFNSELHSWVTRDGDRLQGILYKPENFDKNIKYPVIFNYYETKSADLNGYWKPEILSTGSLINIPLYLSKGYLVFTPDIHFFTSGKTGESALEAVESAADYLCLNPWVDKQKMGIQGCSFSGFTTNYIVTHSTKFAAACSASGGTDFISYYGDLHDGIGSQQAQFEKGQYRLGTTLWGRPDLYIENSPIFQLHNVTTPLLMMSTKQDMAVPPTQAIEMFTGLRRLGKKVWHLRYKEGNHGVYGREGSDFGNRMLQFFDFFLKDSSAPIWMLNDKDDIKNNLKNPFELDKTGRKPGPGLLNLKERQFLDSLKSRKPIEIKIK